jgi:adenine-specific DNA-methyltransferase
MTELTWEGKYKDGRKVAPLRIALPFQTVETVNESAQERQKALDLFSAGREQEWRNRLIWGDRKYVLPSLLPEFAGRVDLIYIDPPFDTGADFTYTATIPGDPEGENGGASFVKEPSVIEQKAYRDTWGRGLDSYLQWFYETVILLRELLADTGSLYVHLDWHIVHYAKAVLDEGFGSEALKNEIIWHYENKLGTGWAQSTFDSRHDTLLVYTKTDRFVHNEIREPVKVQKEQPVTQKIEGKRVWLRDEEGNRIYAMSSSDRPVGDVWTLPIINPVANERLGYPTQKPEALLERILRASSNEGDLILDCFCGSGTTAAVAEKLRRRWIAADLGRFAIHTTRKRLLAIDGVKPFVVQNLGKYERQVWQAAEFGEQSGRLTTHDSRLTTPTAELAYRCFILDLYRARSLSGYNWLHGVKNGRMVHVGAVDSPVSVGDITQIALEFRRASGTGEDAPTTNGVDVLGWDFAFELNEVARQQAALANLSIRFVRIPREVLEKKAVEQGDIRFFELAALAVDVVIPAKAGTQGRAVKLELTDFIIPVDDVPEDIQKAITHWSQWIDYWAVDWDNRSDAFHNEWQSYRTRKNKELARSASHVYDAPGEYTVVVKVIDILGNDTTKTLKVVV